MSRLHSGQGKNGVDANPMCKDRQPTQCTKTQTRKSDTVTTSSAESTARGFFFSGFPPAKEVCTTRASPHADAIEPKKLQLIG
jgi:hypothetical protein